MAASLSAEKWKTFFDTDGRLVDELGLRKTIFSCDLDPAIRREVWRFLYGLYPANSTHRERKAIDMESHARYLALKARWKTLDMAVSSDYVPSHDLFYLDGQEEEEEEEEEETGGSQDAGAKTDKRTEDGTLLKMLDITAKLYATQQDVDLSQYTAAKRLVLKDVIRTDRSHPFFKIKENLRKVHHVLLVHAMFHPELSYLQGYNDIAARFLVVLESEVDCYWAFKLYVEKRKEDFSETGMIHRTQLVSSLLKEMDTELHQFIMAGECSHFLFCHRWLLLNFKREFSMEDGIRMFEVLSSQYLELSSDEAVRAKHKAVAVEFLAKEGGLEVEATGMNLEYTFDVFLCVAILTEHRDNILKTEGAVELIGYINSLSHKMVVSEVLQAAQALVYKYCQLSAKKGLHLVNPE